MKERAHFMQTFKREGSFSFRVNMDDLLIAKKTLKQSKKTLYRVGMNIPYMSPPYGIPVLTLLMGASMFIQQKMTPTPGDPTQATMMMFLPIIFTVMFINFPSGLVLYWLINNMLSIGQQYLIKRSAD